MDNSRYVDTSQIDRPKENAHGTEQEKPRQSIALAPGHEISRATVQGTVLLCFRPGQRRQPWLQVHLTSDDVAYDF